MKYLWIFALALGLFLTACGDMGVAGDPSADGARFSRTFRYYYAESCRYDAVGPYDCYDIEVLNPVYLASLRVDSDGFASLNLDGDWYYYTEREYKEFYDRDYGSYFEFYEDDGTVRLYKDGSELSFWDSWNGEVSFYYYEI